MAVRATCSNEASTDRRSGPEVELDPYNDPVWDSVETGSGQTYQGKAPSLAIQFPSITSMFFSAGRLFYSLKGQSNLHWRWFNPESGVVGADQFVVSDGLDWSTVAGAVLSAKHGVLRGQGDR